MPPKRCLCCGKKTRNKCGTCKSVAYCSQECIKNDWAVHKPFCHEAQLKEAVHDLKDREVTWLKSLPDRDKKMIDDAWDDDVEHFPWNHHVYFIQFALVLGGVMPCHYHDVMENQAWSNYTAQFCEKVLDPWFAQYQTFLEKQGFRYTSFSEPIELCPCEGLPAQREGCQNSIELAPAPLFWNKKHKDAGAVKEAFFREPNQEETTTTTNGTSDTKDESFEILRILGITSGAYSCFRPPNHLAVNFDIVNPKEYFGDDQACCSVWLRRFTNDETAQEVGEYFAKCKQPLQEKFDIPVRLDICPTISDRDLSAEGYAHLVVAAADKDPSIAMRVLDSFNDKHTLVNSGKVTAIKELIREHCPE